MKTPRLSRLLRCCVWCAGVLAAALAARAEFLLEAKDVKLEFNDGLLQFRRDGATVAEVKAIEFNFYAPVSWSVASRSDTRVVLRVVYPASANYIDEHAELPVDIVIEPVMGGFRFTAKPEWAGHTTVRLRDLDDHFFGVLQNLYPNNRHSPDLRGATVDVDANGSKIQYRENFASVWSAFFMTARGYASFFDTFAKGRYALGVNGETELYHTTGALDWYVFVGSNGDELLTWYYKVIGAPKTPPLWAMGPVGWRDENKGGSAEILADVAKLSAMRVPFTAWFADRPYCDGANAWSKMTFSAKFPNPPEWIGKLQADYGLKFMTWVAPMTFGDRDFPGLFPGDFSYMDLSNPETVAEFERRMAAQYAAGVRGHKCDRADELFPETFPWKDGTPVAERRNKYLYLYSKTVHETLTRACGPETFNFSRAAYHRSQPYLSAVWGGDSRASWDGMASNLANAMRCGFQGFPVWGTDVGGYIGGRINEELYARWMQWGVWVGLYEIKFDAAVPDPGDKISTAAGVQQDRPPWAYSERLQKAFREACELRMKLLPYTYSLAQTSAHTGVLMKPLAYVWPGDGKTYSIADEYLFGQAFLVAPITRPGGKRTVYLPAGRWHDFHEPGKTYAGGQTIEVTAPFERIPVFVRANSIYVTGALPLGNRRQWEPELKPSYAVHVTPGDAGQSADFELIDSLDGNQAKPIMMMRRGAAVRFRMPALGAGGEVVIRQSPPAVVRVRGREGVVAYDPAAAAYRVPFEAGAKVEIEVVIAEGAVKEP